MTDPAFPSGAAFGGMTLRDYFAAQALSGLLTQQSIDSVKWKQLAEQAYNMAEAMIQEKEVRESNEGDDEALPISLV